MGKSLHSFTIILGVLHLCLGQTCVNNCKTQFADALTSTQNGQPDCLKLSAYLACVAKCGQEAVSEIQRASQEVQSLCVRGSPGGPGGSNPAAVFESPEFKNAMAQCSGMQTCYAGVDMSNVEITNMEQICKMMKPAMTCIKSQMDSCSALSAEEKTKLSAGVEQMMSLCVEGGVGLQIVGSWLTAVGATAADVAKASQCQAMKKCAKDNPVDMGKVMTAALGSEINMKSLCQMALPLYSCTAGVLQSCQLPDKLTRNFRGSSRLYGALCQLIESGSGKLDSTNSIARIMGSPNQESSAIAQPTCDKWMECLAKSEAAVQDECSQLNSASSCYETAAEDCQAAQEFKAVAEQAKMEYLKRCNGGSHVAPVFGTIMTLIALACAMMF